jgi:3-dehydroquinate dehydratase/shikimate dehydrogenase
VSILPKNKSEALDLIDKAEMEEADFIEVRLDLLRNTEGLAELAKRGTTAEIATIKPLTHGGGFKGTESEQKEILLSAAKNGFSYVDIDLSASNFKDFTTEAREQGVKIIVSHHDFNRTPKRAELARMLDRELACGPDVCKIVTTARQLEDNLALLDFTRAACKKADIICFAMGELGKISRLLSPRFGGFFTFAALEHGGETAPGQMTVKEMRVAYKLLGL